ncbi:MAG: YdeI/OmpD-associated family protein [Oscillospiraceae bacterium]|nr:YdeI/OmpD-associated family protein [Oscillospiraceae bacterium]
MGKLKSDANEMPIGLLMSLAQHQSAMKNFALLDDKGQKSVIQYIENSTTGAEAKSRIQNAVNNLEQGNSGFLG